MFAFCRVISSRAFGCKAGAVVCAAAVVMLAGCVPAESTRYRGTMSRSVQPERSAAAEVAGAFGLAGESGSAVNLAVAGD